MVRQIKQNWGLWLTRLACLSLLAFVFITGCAGGRAVDSTRLAEALTAGESKVTYSVVPGSIAGMPNNVVAIPTVPGKDVEFDSFYPDGTPQWKLRTSRSVVTDAIISGISEADAAKFAQDAMTREWVMGLVDRGLQLATPFLTAALAKPEAQGTTSEPRLRDILKAELQAALPSLIEQIKASLPKPTTQTSGGP